MLSASPLDPQAIIFTASPPAVPTVAAITSYVTSMMELRSQIIATIEQDLSNALYTVGQVIAQEESAVEQQWERLLGITPPASNPSLNSTVGQPSSGSGAGQGHASGSGSGSNAATTAYDNPHSRLDATPEVSGSGSASLSGPYSGSATVTGKVWLDNNGDGSINNNEMDYAGATVNLWVSTDGGSTWSIQTSTTTSSATQGYNYTLRVGYGYPWPSSYIYKVQVAIPSDFYATLPGTSQIDAQGYSQTFSLSPGGTVYVTGGLCSMDVSTLDDDPNGPLSADQDEVTLRDAIETGNNGGGIGHGSTIEPVTFYLPGGGTVAGTINLQAELPDIAESYDIEGPGAAALTVNANAKGTVYTLDTGKTDTLSGQTITGGSGVNGGGILNKGNLTLKSDKIKGNTATNIGSGGGGGLYNAGGTVTITGGTVITGNNAAGGGGIYNSSGTVTASGGTVINSNRSTGRTGGGVVNKGTFLMTGGTISQNSIVGSGETYGGGVFNSLTGSMRLLGVQVEGNSAVKGGGIYTSGKLVLAQNTSISGYNKASGDGAGIYLKGGTAVMDGGGVTNNTAEHDGGGIYVYGGQLMLNFGVNVSRNTAVEYFGGGIYISGGKVTVSSGWMTNNQAGGSGGAIYNFTGTLTLEGSLNITDNMATNQGGGCYLQGAPNLDSTTTFNGVTVSGNQTDGSQKTTGWGVYWENGANVNITALTDGDDPNGKPYEGP